jgi:hypothetical protein
VFTFAKPNPAIGEKPAFQLSEFIEIQDEIADEVRGLGQAESAGERAEPRSENQYEHQI